MGVKIFCSPITFQWNAQSGLEQEGYYSGFSAQNVQGVIPEAVGQDQKGYLTLSDRPIIAAMVNAIKALEAKNKALAAALEALMKRLEALEAAQWDFSALLSETSRLCSKWLTPGHFDRTTVISTEAEKSRPSWRNPRNRRIQTK